MTTADLRKELVSLDDAAQAETVRWLINLLDGADPHEGAEDSLSEAKRRGAELSSGAVKGLSREEFFEGLRNG